MSNQIKSAMELLCKHIDDHADHHQRQIKLEAQQAMKQIRRKADFPARSAGQRRRYQRINGGEK